MSDVEFQLLETMRASGGQIDLLERHLERLTGAARHFGFACDQVRVREDLLREARKRSEDFILRMLVGPDGSFEIQVKPIDTTTVAQRLVLSPHRVDSKDPFLSRKTTARQAYMRAREGIPADADALLVNERGEVTETTIANVAIERDGHWITPRLTCGLLPGTMRAELLERGEIVEAILRLEDLREGMTVRCFNSVRGVYDVPLEI